MPILPVLAAIAALTQTPPPVQDVQQKALPFIRARQYLPALNILEDPKQYTGEADKFIAEYIVPQLYLQMGRIDKAMQLMEGTPKASATEELKSSSLDQAKREDAIAAIVREAKKHRIVMINEYHHIPLGRAFILQLARELRKHGFTYYAAEAFPADQSETVNTLPFRTDVSGYIAEPNFADLVRQVKKMGYTLVQYEGKFERTQNPVETNNRREEAAVANLIERTLKMNPRAKILVHTGMDHIVEAAVPSSSGEYTMLGHLIKKQTGIDPLTIDQYVMVERSHPAFEHPVYRYAAAKGWLKKPSVFSKRGGGYEVLAAAGIVGPGRVDMQVFHPRVTIADGRPSWLSIGGYRKPYRLDPRWLTSGRSLVQAFVASEGTEAVPMDQLLVDDPASAPVLMLPKGEYILVVQNELGDKHTQTRIRQR